VSGDVVEFVRKLKAEPGRDICMMGGGELARPLFEAGLIDEVGMNVHPVLLGSGVPMFHAMRQVDLERIDCRPFRNGCVYVLYAVRGRRATVKARVKAKERPTAKKGPAARPRTKRRAAKKKS